MWKLWRAGNPSQSWMLWLSRGTAGMPLPSNYSSSHRDPSDRGIQELLAVGPSGEHVCYTHLHLWATSTEVMCFAFTVGKLKGKVALQAIWEGEIFDHSQRWGETADCSDRLGTGWGFLGIQWDVTSSFLFACHSGVSLRAISWTTGRRVFTES